MLNVAILLFSTSGISTGSPRWETLTWKETVRTEWTEEGRADCTGRGSVVSGPWTGRTGSRRGGVG